MQEMFLYASCFVFARYHVSVLCVCVCVCQHWLPVVGKVSVCVCVCVSEGPYAYVLLKDASWKGLACSRCSKHRALLVQLWETGAAQS